MQPAIHINLNAHTSACQLPLTYQWTGPNGTYTSEDININSSNALNTGNYQLTISDAYGCKETFDFYAENKPVAGADVVTCAGTLVALSGASPNTGTWSQISGGAGGSLSSTSNGAATATFDGAAGGVYTFKYETISCSDTMKVTVSNQEAGLAPDFAECYVDAVVTLAATGTGTWSVDPSSDGNVQITNSNDPNTTLTNFDAAGSYKLVWTNGSCKDEVIVTVGNNCSCPITDNVIKQPGNYHLLQSKWKCTDFRTERITGRWSIFMVLQYRRCTIRPGTTAKQYQRLYYSKSYRRYLFF